MSSVISSIIGTASAGPAENAATSAPITSAEVLVAPVTRNGELRMSAATIVGTIIA